MKTCRRLFDILEKTIYTKKTQWFVDRNTNIYHIEYKWYFSLEYKLDRHLLVLKQGNNYSKVIFKRRGCINTIFLCRTVTISNGFHLSNVKVNTGFVEPTPFVTFRQLCGAVGARLNYQSTAPRRRRFSTQPTFAGWNGPYHLPPPRVAPCEGEILPSCCFAKVEWQRGM